jgi:hypothetical protein
VVKVPEGKELSFNAGLNLSTIVYNTLTTTHPPLIKNGGKYLTENTLFDLIHLLA